jgi:hypothetical protein
MSLSRTVKRHCSQSATSLLSLVRCNVFDALFSIFALRLVLMVLDNSHITLPSLTRLSWETSRSLPSSQNLQSHHQSQPPEPVHIPLKHFSHPVARPRHSYIALSRPSPGKSLT